MGPDTSARTAPSLPAPQHATGQHRIDAAAPTGQALGIGADRNREVHNATVHETVARVGLCAQIHLPTGRLCMLPYRHRGSCDFRPPHEAAHIVEGF